MTTPSGYVARTWTARGCRAALAAVLVLAGLAAAPFLCGGQVIDKLTTLFVYILLATMWNLLSGYAGLVSAGQQLYFGLGGYFALRLVTVGVDPYPALFLGAVLAAVAALPISALLLKLRADGFAIASWVLAEAVRILVMFDLLVQGETGTSLLALNSYAPDARVSITYWFALASLAVMLAASLLMLRSKIGLAGQAIRDDEDAAQSVGIRIIRTKQIIYVLAAFGSALAGVIWLASAVTFLPRINFGVQWTIFMLFMVLVGGIRTIEGPVMGAVIFFLMQEAFGNYGAWYMFGIGLIAVIFAQALPGGLWDVLQRRWSLTLFSTAQTLVERSAGVCMADENQHSNSA